jgi:hypothetical protein
MLHSIRSLCYTYRNKGYRGHRHKHSTRRLHKVNTYTLRQHRQDYIKQKAKTIIQTVNRQDLEARTGFIVHFRAQLRTRSYSKIGILVLHGSSSSNGSKARKAFSLIQ